MDLLETAFLSKFWNKTLNKFNATSKVQRLIFTILRISWLRWRTFLGSFDSFEIEARGAPSNSEYKAKRVRCESTDRKGLTACRAEKNLASVQPACHRLPVGNAVACRILSAKRPLRMLFSHCDISLRKEAKALHSDFTHYASDLDAKVYPDQLVKFVKFAEMKDCYSLSLQAKLLCCNTEIEQTFSNVCAA